MLKLAASGAVCALLAVATSAAPVEQAHYKPLKAQCHCPKGYDYVKGNCVTEEVVPKQPICPFQKFPHYADVCLKPVAPINDCPVDFVLVPKVGCVKDDDTAVDYTCPKGFFYKNNHCERSFKVPPVEQCKDGWFLETGTCYKPVSTPVDPVCQTGAVQVGSQCFLEQTGNSALECPVGFELVGLNCEKVQFAKKVYVCHWHYRNVFDQDVDTHPTKKCPKTVNVPCGKSHRKLAPEDASVEEAGVQHGAYSQGKKHHAQHAQKHLCTKTEYYPARGRCPRGFVPIDAASQKYTHTHAYNKKDKPDCYKVETVVPEIICLDNVVDDSCEKVIQVPFDLTCPADTTRVGKECIKYDSEDPTLVCPPYSTEINSAPTCQVTRTIPAKPTCPVGFELKDDKCIQLTIVAPRTCPTYAIEKNGTCFVKVDPIYRCPKGFEPSATNNTECVATKTHPPVCEHVHQKGHANQGYPWVDNYSGHY